MPERTSYEPGTPSWIDLMTTDPDAARGFYTELFGWDYQDEPTPEGDVYTLCMKNGKAAAGLGKLSAEHQQAGMPPAWTTYVTVASADDAHTKVGPAGGENVSPVFDVMDAGRMAVVRDPTGAVFCVWEPKNVIGAELVNEHGTLSWNELITTDVPKAVDFYGKFFGWGTEETPGGPSGSYTVWKLGDDDVGGCMAPPVAGMPSFWGIYFAVDDCDAVVDKAKSLGATVFMEPMDLPDVGRMAALGDPQGAMFSVIELAQPPS